MKKSYLWALLITAGAALWVASGMFGPAEKGTTLPQDEARAESGHGPVQVQVRDSTAATVTAAISVTGRTEAARRVDIKAEVASQVEEIIVEKGGAVKAGDVIARLAVRDRRARVDEAKQRLHQREIEYNAARELQAKGFNSRVKLAQSSAEMEAARAELKKAELDLAHTEIKAPFGGVIADQAIEIGDYAEVGKRVFTVVELDPMELSGFVTEKQVASIVQGSPVKAALLNGMTVEGELSYVAPSADPATRTFRIEVRVPNPDRLLVEGMTATMQIPMRPVKAHRIMPSSLTLDDAGRVGIKVVAEGDRVEFLPVMIVADEPDGMLVAGLPDHVRLITVGQDYAGPGEMVVPVAMQTPDQNP